MNNKYLHWVVICVIIGTTFFCAQKLSNQYQKTNLVFHQPNTEWKTRTITLDDGRRITYEFGKGNPREVMPKLSDYTLPEQDYFHDAIVRPKTEKLLKEFLSNPILVTVMNKCGHLIVPDA